MASSPSRTIGKLFIAHSSRPARHDQYMITIALIGLWPASCRRPQTLARAICGLRISGPVAVVVSSSRLYGLPYCGFTRRGGGVGATAFLIGVAHRTLTKDNPRLALQATRSGCGLYGADRRIDLRYFLTVTQTPAKGHRTAHRLGLAATASSPSSCDVSGCCLMDAMP